MSNIRYHLDELAVVENSQDPRRFVPELRAGELDILDIGCGIGQTLVASELKGARRRAGVDIDGEAIQFGLQRFPYLELRVARAEQLPYPEGSFDLVFSRVALPYTNIPAALAEICRVLRKDGRLWIALHGKEMEMKRFRDAMSRRRIMPVIDSAYVWANSALLHSIGKSIPRPWNGTHESFQTASGIGALLGKLGYRRIEVKSTPFTATAIK